MELAVATQEARARSALTVASLQVLLLIALSFGISYLVRRNYQPGKQYVQ
jgi:hypothetical protein